MKGKHIKPRGSFDKLLAELSFCEIVGMSVTVSPWLELQKHPHANKDKLKLARLVTWGYSFGTGGSSSKLIAIMVPTIAGAVILSIIVALLLVKKTSSKRKKTHTSLIGYYN
ncbi:hypothetical protein MRB53_030709 [Persea americana]|uniref:Uncharacterized protein n=1 Tax=Persea americana TaxID=3435 RepID=A0ACC2KMF2_PERAE|nr:hypothetical protein MRB53_030709 [Persea americana]